MMMKRSAVQWIPSAFDRYIDLVGDIDLQEALEKSLQQLNEINIPDLRAAGSRVYAPGKWAVPDILQHIADAERVFAYRALRFARNDRTPLHGFDQDRFASGVRASLRDPEDIVNELKALRRSTIFLFQSFDDEMLMRKGICDHAEVTVLALGFMIVGHQIHHLRIIAEKYLFPAKDNE